MTDTTPRGNPEIVDGQALPGTAVTEGFHRLEAGAGRYPVAGRVTSPPGSCADGATYLIIATATGAFSGKEGQLATAVGANAASGWLYRELTAIDEGVVAYVQAEGAEYKWSGSDWEALSGVGPLKVMTASEAISAGMFGNIHATSGAKVRKANATDDTKPCDCFVPAAIGNGLTGSVQGPGSLISGLTGLTAGADYYLDTTAGGATATPPSGSGNLVQKLGKAVSTTELFFNPLPGVTLA